MPIFSSSRTRRRTAVAFSLVTAAALTMTACAGGDSTAGESSTQKATVIVTQGAWSSSYAFLAVAEQRGYFEDEGIDVNFVNVAGGTDAGTQLEQGQADVAITSNEALIIGREGGRGFESKMYSLLFRRSMFGIAAPADSSVNSIADLAGKKVGVASLSSSGVQIAKAVATEAGIDPNSINFIEIGVGAQAVAAVQSGAIDALSVYDSQYQIMENSGIELKRFESELTEGLNGGGFAARPETIENNPELLVGFARAAFKGIHFCEVNAEACVQDLWEFEPATKPQSVDESSALANDVKTMNVRLEGSYSLAEGETQWGSFPEGTYQKFVSYMEETGQIEGNVDPESVYTDELIDDINTDLSMDQVTMDAENA